MTHSRRPRRRAGRAGGAKNFVRRFALCNPDRIRNAILSMEDCQDLLLAPKVEDLRRKVFELAAIIGRPDAQP